MESIATPAEFGESSTENLRSISIGTLPKSSAFDADETNFVVVLPRHVIARADVNILLGKRVADDRLHGFGLRFFLRSEPAAVQHVQEIGVAAGVELIGALDLHSAFAEEIDDRAVQDGRAHLRLDVVADERQIFFLETLRPDRIAGDENRDVVDQREPGFERAADVKARRFLAPTGK